MKCARVALLIPVVMMLSLFAVPGAGNAQVPPWLQPSPASGSPGSAFSITYGAFYSNCPTVFFLWDASTSLGSGRTPSGSVGVTVPPSAKIGRHYLYGQTDCGESVVRIPFDVIAPTVPPTTPPTTTPPTIPPTIPITTSPRPPTTRPTTTTRRPTTTTTAPATTTDPAIPTTEPTTPTDPGTSTGADKDGGDPGDLVFDKPAVQAGDPLAATGSGCHPRSRVTLTSGGERVGTATADSHGGFTTPVEFTRIEPGRHTVTASCGIVLVGNVDLILTSSTSGSTGTLVVLVFFLLVAVTLAARSRT